MISSPVLLAATLFGLVSLVLYLSKRPALEKLFHYLPAAFWCYFTPTLLASFGFFPDHSPIYDFLTTYVLCACLVLLLLDINLPSIFRLGPTALGAMVVGALGIAIGAVGSYSIFARWLPDETWKGIGALSASWIGGNANMLAVKEALQTSDSVFAPMVIVDTVVTYSWMGVLVALAPWQETWDHWVKADRSTLDDVNRRLSAITAQSQSGAAAPAWHALWLIALGMGVGWICLRIGAGFSHPGSVLSASGWGFVLVTLVGVGISLTPAARLERYGASRWGYFCLYLLLAAIGAKAHLQYIFKAPLLIVMAYVWIGIHALLLAGYGYWRKTPMFFLVTSSQANIGGTASTPIVAGVYQSRLASLGLLLAICGNVIGTYAGLAIAQACRLAQK